MSDSQGLTYHFCPECGSTLYWDISDAPDFVGVAVGNFTDPTFPPPVGAGFEAYGAAYGPQRPKPMSGDGHCLGRAAAQPNPFAAGTPRPGGRSGPSGRSRAQYVPSGVR